MGVFKCGVCGCDNVFEDGITVGACRNCGARLDLTETEVPPIPNLVRQDINVEECLNQAFALVEQEDWQGAFSCCNTALEADPKCAKAYLCKLMIQCGVKAPEELAKLPYSFEGSENYQNAIRFADGDLAKTLKDYLNSAVASAIQNQKEDYYNQSVAAMNAATGEAEFRSAAEFFGNLGDYKDSAELKATCIERADVAAKDAIYDTAQALALVADAASCREAIEKFSMIPGWKDADEQATALQEKLAVLESEEEQNRIRDAYIAQAQKEDDDKRKKRRFLIFGASGAAAVLLAGIILACVFYFIPEGKYSSAVTAMRAGDYERSIELFTGLGDYRDSESLLFETEYMQAKKKAASLTAEKKYDDAVEVYKRLNEQYANRKDLSGERLEKEILIIRYDAATNLYNTEQYADAKEAFAALGDYLDSADKVKSCDYFLAKEEISKGNYASAIQMLESLGGSDGLLNATRYDYAKKLFSEKDYASAKKYFEDVQKAGYRDVSDEIKKCTDGAAYGSTYLNTAVGATITLGSYEQDGKTSNGKEAIKWIVLAKQDGKLLVISEKVLDSKLYNSTDVSTTWATCSLNQWLNGEFLNSAFSSSDQSKILSSTVSADANPDYPINQGESTTAKIFLLSVSEADKYFNDRASRKAELTAYARGEGAADSSNGEGASWWLRTTGSSKVVACLVSGVGGDIDTTGFRVDNTGVGVRPAMWINP